MNLSKELDLAIKFSETGSTKGAYIAEKEYDTYMTNSAWDDFISAMGEDARLEYLAGGGDELVDLLHRQAHGALQLRHVSLVERSGDEICHVGVAVADDKGDTADEHRGLTTSRSRENKKGTFGCKDGLALLVVERSVGFIEKSALGGYVALRKMLIHLLTSFHSKGASAPTREGRTVPLPTGHPASE